MNFRRSISAAVNVIIFFILASTVNAFTSLPIAKVSDTVSSLIILTESGKVWGCFHNEDHQLGDSTDRYRYVPVQVYAGDMHTDSNCLENIIAISAGWKNSYAIDCNHRVLSWGYNAHGELGRSALTPFSAVPVFVDGGEMGTAHLQYIIGIAAGIDSSDGGHCLTVDSNHFCWSWGINNYGQLGDVNNYPAAAYSPVRVHGVGGTGNDYYLSHIISVSAGQDYSVALDVNGSVYTFGNNNNNTYYGKLGINITSGYRGRPVKVHGVHNVGFLKNIVAISAGWDHCMALEKIDGNDPNCKGRVYTWGRNSGILNNLYCYQSVLGNGSSNDACTPVIVKAGEQNPGDSTAVLQNIVAVSAGASHCMALDANGSVWCWGSNTQGELGNYKDSGDYGYWVCENVPVKVVGFNGNGFLKDINSISAGQNVSFAVDKSGTLWIWGTVIFYDFSANYGLSISPVPCHIYELNVYNKNKNNKCYKRIAPAINEADSNNVIELSEGCFSEDVNLGNKPIILRSQDPCNLSVVNHTRIYGSSWRDDDGLYWGPIISLKNNTGSVISGLTLIGGSYGIDSNNSNPLISHCRIQDNSTDGISVSGGSATIIKNNIIFHNNNKSSTSGIYLHNCGSLSEIRNNSIIENSLGIGKESTADDPIINSNIIYYNVHDIYKYNCSSFTKVNYNCIQYYDGTGTGNKLGVDPCFVNKDNNDFHLRYNSPCIDAGDPSFNSSTEKDIDGERRKMDGNIDGTVRIDMGADEFKIVDFVSFSIFANAWRTDPNNPKWNAACDFVADNKINIKDLRVFAANWLRPTDWSNGGEGTYFTDNSSSESMMLMSSEDDSSLMQSESSQSSLAVAGTATIEESNSQQSSSEEQQQSYLPDYNLPAIYLTCDNNTPQPNDEVTIQVHSVAPLFAMGLGIYISGDANITTAMSEADCNSFGWDNGWNSDPYIDPNGWAYLNGVKWDADVNGVVSYVKFRYHSGQVSVYIDQENSLAFEWDGDSCPIVPFSQEVLYISRDPNEP
jgi:alpha-tubulin suppressor-like RCC1 family protein